MTPLTFNIFIIWSEQYLLHVVTTASYPFCVILKVDKQTMHQAVIRWHNQKYPKTLHSINVFLLLTINMHRRLYSRMAFGFKCDSICVKFKTETRFSTKPECFLRAIVFHVCAAFDTNSIAIRKRRLLPQSRVAPHHLQNEPVCANHYAPDWVREGKTSATWIILRRLVTLTADGRR